MTVAACEAYVGSDYDPKSDIHGMRNLRYRDLYRARVRRGQGAKGSPNSRIEPGRSAHGEPLVQL